MIFVKSVNTSQNLPSLPEDDEVITGPYNTVTKSLKSGDKVEEKSTEDEEENEENDSE